jgi:hypothetical protein
LRALPVASLPAGLRQEVEKEGAIRKLAVGSAGGQALAAEFDHAIKVATGHRYVGEQIHGSSSSCGSCISLASESAWFSLVTSGGFPHTSVRGLGRSTTIPRW